VKGGAVNSQPLPSCGLPSWATVALDGAIGAGLIPWSALDGLTSKQLLALARELTRAQLRGVDVAATVEQVAKG
jgi:hypothetical protein